METSLTEFDTQGKNYFKVDFIHLTFIIGMYFAGSIMAVAVQFGLNALFGYENTMKYWQGVVYALPFIITLFAYYYAFLKNKDIRYNFGFSLSPWYIYPVITLLFLGAMILNEPLANAIPTSGLNGVLDELYSIIEQMEKMLVQYPVSSAFMIAILAPIFEELLFRGMILKGMLNNGMKPWLAIGVSAFIFAFIHFNPWQFVGAFLLGLILGWVYYKTQSLLNTMFLHFFNNSIGVLLFFKSKNMNLSEVAEADASQAILVGVLLLVVFGSIFYHLTKNRRWKFY